MHLGLLLLLAAGHCALAQSSLTVSMAWSPGNPWAAYEMVDFGDETMYLVGCLPTADPEDCIIYTPFTLTQAPNAARFTTTLPGESTKTFIHYCTWSGRTEGCGVSDNFGDGWKSMFMTPDLLKNTETVIPIITRSRDFLTLEEASQTTSTTTSTRRTPTFTQPWETASATGPDFDFDDDDDDDENEDRGGGGGILQPPGIGGIYGGLQPGQGEEGYAERRAVGDLVGVIGVAAAVGAALW